MSQAQVIANCPNPWCNKAILIDHPHSRCTKCGDTLPSDIQAKIPSLQKIVADAARAGQNIAMEPQRRSSSTFGDLASSSSKPLLMFGIIMVVVAVAVIIVSQNLFSILNPQFQRDVEPIRALQSLMLLGGIGLLIVGGIVSAVGVSKFISTRPTTPPAPTTQPVVTRSVAPKSVELGNTPDEVQSVMGQPDKIIDLGARVIHVYQDMKIIYDDGKVSDVQLS